MGYYGKYSMSKKAVDIDLLKIEPITYQPGTTQATLDHIAGGSMIGGIDMAFSQMNLNAGSQVVGSNSFLIG